MSSHCRLPSVHDSTVDLCSSTCNAKAHQDGVDAYPCPYNGALQLRRRWGTEISPIVAIRYIALVRGKEHTKEIGLGA
ncbi:hypothetical protein TWF173_010287 [Orbilia oligospora]|nr:hypothetical protein TWF173_010287 [Orbilia oligospora]